MLNNLILVGRLARDIEVYQTANGRQMGRICLAIPRSFKNMEGVYETDFIPCILWEEKAKIASSYCHKGDVIGVRGRLQSRLCETPDGNRYVLEVVAERLTFLSSNTKKEPEKEVVEEKDNEDITS